MRISLVNKSAVILVNARRWAFFLEFVNTWKNLGEDNGEILINSIGENGRLNLSEIFLSVNVGFC